MIFLINIDTQKDRQRHFISYKNFAKVYFRQRMNVGHSCPILALYFSLHVSLENAILSQGTESYRRVNPNNGKLTTTIRYADEKITNQDEVDAAQQEFFRKLMELEEQIKESSFEELMREVQ